MEVHRIHSHPPAVHVFSSSVDGSPANALDTMPGSVRAQRLAPRNHEHSIELVTQHHAHHGHDHSGGCGSPGKARKHKQQNGSRDRSRGRSPARARKDKKNKRKTKHGHSPRMNSHREAARGSDSHAEAKPVFTGPPFMNPHNKGDDEDKLVIDDDKDQSCSAAFSKENLHLLARQLVSEAIGCYFLVTTVGLVGAQGLMLGPVAVGNANKYNDVDVGLYENN